MGRSWRDWFRRDCRAIAYWKWGDEGVMVRLCSRRRWHSGECRA